MIDTDPDPAPSSLLVLGKFTSRPSGRSNSELASCETKKGRWEWPTDPTELPN
ncbi:hypothetical protein FTUN_8836 [Frigoriglobus tundricola]|uniref:Uncharacterized protein n=1 Tax=Frigoriglobus tundricola TaxID=2774151 RepID=A0A6M5Z5T6_9BACT|nr:hypothetical protein FTUN_8836 [Frigoriglobus tundricola]